MVEQKKLKNGAIVHNGFSNLIHTKMINIINLSKAGLNIAFEQIIRWI